jgi:hypothetical protein
VPARRRPPDPPRIVDQEEHDLERVGEWGLDDCASKERSSKTPCLLGITGDVDDRWFTSSRFAVTTGTIDGSGMPFAVEAIAV